MIAALDRARDLLEAHTPISSWCWLDDQGRWTSAAEARSMLRLSFRLERGFTSARIAAEDAAQLRPMLPAEIFA